MKKLLCLLTGIAISVSAQTPDLEFINRGVNDYGTNAPQVNAISFINYGTFSVLSDLPYDFENTLNFTNEGIISGAVGFRFETVKSDGEVVPAASFYNEGGWIIQANETPIQINPNPDIPDIDFGFGTLPGSGLTMPNYLYVNATNIINKGLLSAGVNGVLRIEGEEIDLSRGGLEIAPMIGGSSMNVPTNTFYPDLGIYDAYWNGRDNNNNWITNQVIAVDGLISLSDGLTNVSGPSFPFEGDMFGGTLPQGSMPPFMLENPNYGIVVEQPSDTNVLVQAVFVGGMNTNIESEILFFQPSALPNRTPIVRLSYTSTNKVVGDPYTTEIYIKDTLATDTNRGIATNLITMTTYRPWAYELSRIPLLEYLGASEGNTALDDTFILLGANAGEFVTPIVTNFFAGYSANLDFIPTRPHEVEGFTPAELPGRIEIEAVNLDLDRTRIRGEGYVSITADNVTGQETALIEAETLSYNLSADSGLLTIENYVPDTIQRLSGGVSVWSGLWTNFVEVVTEAAGPAALPQDDSGDDDDQGGNGEPQEPTMETNQIEYLVHVMIVDHSMAQTEIPVTVHDFESRSVNTVINDNMLVENKFLISGETLTLNGNLVLSPTEINDWTSALVPNVTSLTNSGAIYVEDTMTIGADRELPFENFVNTGLIENYTSTFQSENFANSGQITTVSRLIINANDVWLGSGGANTCGNDVIITADNVSMNEYLSETQRSLIIKADNLTDTGIDAKVVLSVKDGVRFEALTEGSAVQGDLLGTTIETTAPRFLSVAHQWGAVDMGDVAAGYQNNLAVGRLVLSAEYDAELFFEGVGGDNALYVEMLEFGPGTFTLDDEDNVTIIEESLRIDEDFMIYFAAAEAVLVVEDDGAGNGNGANGGAGVGGIGGDGGEGGEPDPEPEPRIFSLSPEQLEGMFGGRLKWVRGFAGPNSSVEVSLSDGSKVLMNAGLKNSDTIDSDADGRVNAVDRHPLDGATIRGIGIQDGNISLKWNAAAQTTYKIDCADSLENPEWINCEVYYHDSEENAEVTISVPLPEGKENVYFRISYTL
jgi:hypothetical protein